MLRAAYVTVAGLAVLRLRVGGACAMPAATLGASRRLLAGLQHSWSACTVIAKLSPRGRAVGLFIGALRARGRRPTRSRRAGAGRRE
eukprot:14822247-Alexandrium_andersonii.AAC.1